MSRYAEPGIRRDPTKIPNPYRSARARAWRNAMIAAVNAGLEQRLFGLGPGENLWPGAERHEAERARGSDGAVYRFTFPGGIPAIAWVGDAGFDELSVHIALWPLAGAEARVVACNAGRSAGDLWATGWLERRIRPYLQSSQTLFACARSRLAIVSGTEIEPESGSYADRGVLRM